MGSGDEAWPCAGSLDCPSTVLASMPVASLQPLCGRHTFQARGPTLHELPGRGGAWASGLRLESGVQGVGKEAGAALRGP